MLKLLMYLSVLLIYFKQSYENKFVMFFLWFCFCMSRLKTAHVVIIVELMNVVLALVMNIIMANSVSVMVLKQVMKKCCLSAFSKYFSLLLIKMVSTKEI